MNSKPQSPTKDELAAILERAMPTIGAGEPKHRAEWNGAVPDNVRAIASVI